MSFPILFAGHSICRNWHCLEYSAWLREVEYRITVPSQFSVDVATSGGPISVDGLKGDVNAHTSGGSLHFDHIDGPVNGRTSGGSITLAGVKGRTVVHTSGGSIHISEVHQVDIHRDAEVFLIAAVAGRRDLGAGKSTEDKKKDREHNRFR
jgi:hypothetical protein